MPVNAGRGRAVKSSLAPRARAVSIDSSGRFYADAYASRCDACFAAISAR